MVFAKKALFFCIFSFLTLIVAYSAEASGVGRPVIVDIENINNAPHIIGLTPENTDILVYINDKYYGKAEVFDSGTATDNFQYKHPLSLAVGNHEIALVSKQKASFKESEKVKVQFNIMALPRPYLVGPLKKDVVGTPKPIITGLVSSGSLAHVYIDGVYNGKTEIVKHESGTASFAYRPFLNLSQGEHTVRAVAEDESGKKSIVSEKITFIVEPRMPAPTRVSVKKDNHTGDKVVVSGLAKNNSLIKVFVDHQLDGQFKIKNHSSGIAGFVYNITKPLTNGRHLVYTIALDSRGKESMWSNIEYISVSVPVKNITTTDSKDKKIDDLDDQVDNVLENIETDDSEAIVSNEGAEVKDDGIIGKIEIDNNIENDAVCGLGEEDDDCGNEEFLNNGNNEKNSELANDDSLDNEDDLESENTSSINWNVIIFICFLLGVIAWIYWVNKELKKEKELNNKDTN